MSTPRQIIEHFGERIIRVSPNPGRLDGLDVGNSLNYPPLGRTRGASPRDLYNAYQLACELVAGCTVEVYESFENPRYSSGLDSQLSSDPQTWA